MVDGDEAPISFCRAFFTIGEMESTDSVQTRANVSATEKLGPQKLPQKAKTSDRDWTTA
jgi:hypothetical protein